MPAVDTRIPLYVGLETGETATITNTGNVAVYYQDSSKGGTISASVNDGSIAANGTLSIVSPTYLLAASGGAQVNIAFASSGSNGGGGNGLPSGFVTKTGNYTAAAGDFVEADTTAAGFMVTLPSAPAAGSLVAVKNIGSAGNTLTISPSGGGTIDGSSSATTITQWAGAIFEHLGANVWRVAASMSTTGPSGARGSLWYEGSGAPTSIGGQANSDLYLNTSNADVWQLQSGTWTQLGNIHGTNGTNGTNGLGFGSVVAKSANYTVLSGDNGGVFAFNGATLVATLPASAPSSPWMVTVVNNNGTTLTVNPNGLTLNGSASNITLAQNQSVFVWSDGSNYKYGTGPPGPQGAPGSNPTISWYGDGSDGAFTADGSTAMSGATLVGSTYTLNRNLYFASLTVNSGVRVFTNGWILSVKGTLTNAGQIDANGGIPGSGAGTATGTNQGADGSGTGNTAGSGGATGNFLGFGYSGGTANGSAGTNATNSLGGAGGAGGSASGGANAGGAGGTRSALAAGVDATRLVQYATSGQARTTSISIQAGAGGGGAGNDGVNQGGGGGGGGGICIVNAATIVNNGTIQARGAIGAAAVAGNSGGGGGGGGGLLLINTTAYSGTGTEDANGGVGGAKQGTGVAGSNGSNGTARLNIWQ